MGKISIENAKEGMILEQSISDSGRILVPAGVTLNEKHLRLCRSWGIFEIYIEGKGPTDAEQDFRSQVNPEALTAAEAKTAFHFKLTNTSHPAIHMLMQIQIRQQLERSRHV